jgi:D-serine deaminase-like pyridoxal phosphate-dependent protein
MIERGVSSVKTSLNEVELAVYTGVSEIFVAYPILQTDARRVAEFMLSHPEIQIYIQVGSKSHAEVLKNVSEENDVRWSYFIDVDVGMHRTGIAPQRALDLYHVISNWKHFEFIGFHGYDGHIHHPNADVRLQESKNAMGLLMEIVHVFLKKGIKIPRVMVAGSPTFQTDFAILYPQLRDKTHLLVSPGTWIYWDSVYDELLPGAFEIAAVILAQVIEVGEDNRITLNLGHKRWGADQGPVDRFSHPGMKVICFNEEHTVLMHDVKTSFQVGDFVLIAPKHVCSTVNLYEYITVIGEEGDIKELESPVDGRNR